MHFYIIYADDNNPRKDIQEEYIHIKANYPGNRVAIASSNPINHPNAEEKTQEQIQEILDEWINEENANADKNIDGDFIIQSKIDLLRIIRNG